MSQPPDSKQRIRRRYIAIAAVLAIGVFMFFLLGSIAGKKQVSPLRSALASAHIIARDVPPQTAAAVPATMPVIPSSADATQSGVAERVRALLSGPKPEVCGLSDFEAALFVLSGSQPDKNAENATTAVVAAQLSQSKLASEQTLGLTLQAEAAVAASYEEAMRATCGSDEKCREGIRPSPQARAEAAEPLVTRALASRNPAEYAAAAYFCGRNTMGVCAKVSYAGWAQLEPGNAVPWLLIYGDAFERNDPQAQAYAARYITLSTDYDSRVVNRAPLYLSREVAAQPLLTQLQIGTSTIGYSAASSLGATYGLGRYCAAEAVADPARRTSCNSLTEKFLASDQSAIAVSLAGHFGKRVGWSAERLQALEDEKNTILGLMLESASNENQLSCSSLAKNDSWLRESMVKGERGWARELAAKRGKSFAELAEKYRASIR